MEFTQGISIDGTFFDVPLVAIKREGQFLDKYANRTEDGILHRELIGVYYNYDMSFGTMETSVHEALFDKLTEPVEFHTITVPTGHGTYTFVAYVNKATDEYLKIYEDHSDFQNLACKFIAQAPARTP